MNPLEAYIRDLSIIRSAGAGVEETSYYPALAHLFNEIGRTLKPRVRCILQLRNRGAGNPDGGLFTPEQFQKSKDEKPLAGQMPARGVVEVKPTDDDAWVTADGEQVSRYWGKYRQVLVTNYRDFVLVGQDAEGKPCKLESYRLAGSERAFWAATAHPRKLAEAHGERFSEYLRRVMLCAAPLAAPQDVAWFLASYARDAKARIEGAELPALAAVRQALEEALGIKFEDEKGERFFRSTLVQTLFYGVFSAWVLWSSKHPPTDREARFNWHEAAWSLRVPTIRALFEQVATPSKLGPLGLVEVLDWTATVLNRVDRASFFSQFEEGHAVQYFYEPFLEAFDPGLRKELGVWYTPSEIVQYMVARVDTVLRQELDIPDGLADPRVYVLDPCCGTGAYLVEALKRIAATLKQKGGDALVADDLKRAAIGRVFGFEILPAPFVVSHLQLGLLLQNFGAPLSERKNERVGVYLTNALTGWEPPKEPKTRLLFPELEEERDAAEKVKREAPILVILGNPPYNAYAGVSPEEEQGLLDPYKEGLRDWGITKNYLDDLYVRFFRLAERRIAEMTGKGVVCYISNHSWVSDPSFVVLRQRLLASFDRFWIENMHGNRKISEYAPDGRSSETVFAISGFSPGIRQGVAISLWVKNGKEAKRAKVLFRDDLNAARAAERREQLLAGLRAKSFDAQYEPAHPDKSNRFSFRPSEVQDSYLSWPMVTELSEMKPMLGLNENRAGALQDIDRRRLDGRMRAYFDRKITWEELCVMRTGLTQTAAGFEPREVREKVLRAEAFSAARVVRYLCRPFETRWAYVSDVSPLWNRSRPELRAQQGENARFLITRPAAAASPEGVPFLMTTLLGEQDSIRGHAYYFPVWLRPTPKGKGKRNAQQPSLISQADARPISNLSPTARAYLAAVGITDPDAVEETAGLIWMHALATGYSPAYLGENSDGIRQDWPRIPLPKGKEALVASAALGRQVAALLDTETPVPGVTEGAIRPELSQVAVISRVGGGQLDPGAGELTVTAGWGHAGKGGVTMPGKGKVVEREYSRDELGQSDERRGAQSPPTVPGAAGAAALHHVAEHGGRSPSTVPTAAEAAALHALGEKTCDVYLNDTAYWKNVPGRVWDYTIGGYQVMKKWLSYREREMLGRSLTPEECREATNMARRIAAILLLEPALDESYRKVKDAAYAWMASQR